MSDSNNDLLTFKETFKDFISLQYIPGKRNEENLRDILVSELRILRLDKKGCTLCKLDSGLFFRIPWEWVDTFYSFTISYSNLINILYDRVAEIEKLSTIDSVERFGCTFSKFISTIINSGSKLSDINEFNKGLSLILKIGTTPFINWSKEALNMSFRQFELLTKDEITLI